MKLKDISDAIFGNKGSRSNDPFSEIASFKKTCWVPMVKEGDSQLTTSKFAGIPYLNENEPWPVCPNCQNPMQFLVQLNSEELPSGAGRIWGDGLLQFFYCTNTEPLCDVDCEAWSPFSRSTILRIAVPTSNHSAYSVSPVKDAYPAKSIVGWTALDDYPNFEELGQMGKVISYERADEIGQSYPCAGEKLLGWPLWVQGVEYPNCPKCSNRMQLVFQIDSDRNLPIMFGDVGIGHISQCPDHPSELGFGWACS